MDQKTQEQLDIEAQVKSKGLVVIGDDNDEEIIVDDEEPIEVEIDSEPADTESDESQYTETEQQASEGGWMPEDEWVAAGNDPDEWVTAKQFLRNGEYLRKIHNQNRKLKQLDEVVNTLAKQQKKIFNAGYEKAKKELKTQLREATKEGDDAAADVLEHRIEQLEKEKVEEEKALSVQEEEVKEVKSQIAPEFTSWVQRNQWFIKYPEMRAYAEAEGIKYAQANSHKTNVEIYDYVTNVVKKRFPERFGVMKKTMTKQGSPVDGAGNLTATQKREGNATVRVSLTSEEKAVGRTLIAKGVYKNMNEYAADLKKLGVKS